MEIHLPLRVGDEVGVIGGRPVQGRVIQEYHGDVIIRWENGLTGSFTQDQLKANKIGKFYFVVWTYIANYGVIEKYLAYNSQDAANRIREGFSEDFRLKGKVYVFEDAPSSVIAGQLWKKD